MIIDNIVSNENGIITTYEESGDSFLIQHHVDVAPILAQVEKHRNTNPDGFSKDRTYEYVGTIPMIELLKDPELKHDGRKATRWLEQHKEFKLKASMRQTHPGIIVK
jgi:hypothetical protein